MWARYLKPRCASLVMHSVEARALQAVLDRVEWEDKLAPQSMSHLKHFLSGNFVVRLSRATCQEARLTPSYRSRLRLSPISMVAPIHLRRSR